MSDKYPPYGPPPGPTGPPPSQPPGPSAYGPPPTPPPGGGDYAQFGGGQPRPRNPRKWLLGAGSVVAAAALVGGAAFAAASILGGGHDLGPQPAEAVPASAFAYASVDLDPSDGEKGEAIGTLLKFPAVQKHIKLGQSDDLRQTVVQALLHDELGACGGLSWEHDFKPWLGSKAAVAGVDVAGEPTPLLVVQVTDKAKAQAEFDKLKHCGGGTAGISISDGWALVGESQDTVTRLAADAKSHSLADDDGYRKWTGEIGDPGAVMMYAAPSAGDLLAEAFNQSIGRLSGSSASGFASSLSSSTSGMSSSDSSSSLQVQTGPPGSSLGGVCPGLGGDPGAATNQLKSTLQRFGGAAATLRFKDGGVEVESAADLGSTRAAGGNAGDLVGSLPADTAAAVGVSLGENWLDTVLHRFSAVCGPGFDPSGIESQLTLLTGLTFPDDINTLLGTGMALSLGSGFDPSALTSPADLPIALSIKGDSAKIQAVLDKIRARIGNGDHGLLDSDAKGDTVAIGPSSSYRSKVLGAGGLGSNSTFTDVVPHASGSSVILYVNFDQLDDVVSKAVGADELANFKPLKAFGVSGWVDGTTTHSFVRLSTD